MTYSTNVANSIEQIAGTNACIRRQKVLIVDDDAGIRDWMQRVVKPLDVDLIAAADGTSALAAARANDFDLILLDVNLPDMSGHEVCRLLRADPIFADLPIIFLTAAEDAEAKFRAFESGASDYVTKPFDVRELRARVRNALRTESLRAQLETQASTDALTGLPNRAAFRRAVERQIARVSADPKYGFALMFVDLDRFKVINDSLGHEVGDRLLIHVSQSLSALAKRMNVAGAQDWLVARMGGDEFTLVLAGVVDTQVAREVAEAILAALATPALLGTTTIRIGGSIGIRMCRGSEPTALVVGELLRDADVAMYQAKEDGRGRLAIFDQTMHQYVLDRMKMEHDLRLAIARDELELHYQPLVDLQTGDVVAFEALLRWHSPTFGMVPPSTFVPLAEESELILDLGTWVLKTAIAFAMTMRRSHDVASADNRTVQATSPAVPRICINISKRQLARPNFFELVCDLVEQAGIPPAQLELEITETTIMFDPHVIGPVLGALRARGFRLAIDDFGTGYSSLSMLPQFPMDTLKIDRSFISQFGIGRGETAIVNAVVSLAAHLDLTVVAEGIETIDLLAQLQSIGCGLGQGYLFGKAMPANEALSLPRRIAVFDLRNQAA
jgi:diguanylate cyclase (GGDEF)-like protein